MSQSVQVSPVLFWEFHGSGSCIHVSDPVSRALGWWDVGPRMSLLPFPGETALSPMHGLVPLWRISCPQETSVQKNCLALPKLTFLTRKMAKYTLCRGKGGGGGWIGEDQPKKAGEGGRGVCLPWALAEQALSETRSPGSLRKCMS